MSVQHWKLLVLVIACVALSGSRVLAEAGVYETMMKERMLNNVRNAQSLKTVPDAIKVRYSTCFAAALVDGLTADEVRQMNDGAQGVRVNDALAQKALEQLVAIIDRLNNRDLSVLQKVCPGDMADFKAAGL